MRRHVASALVVGLAMASGATVAATAAPADRPARAQIRLTPARISPFELTSVSFGDAHHGHAAGVNGTLLATTDGGVSWRGQEAPVRTGIDGNKESLSVSFPDPLHGHAAGSEGTILATADGGASWTPQQPPTGGVEVGGVVSGWSFRSVSFSDAGAGSIVGGAAILSTSDGGATWSATGSDARLGALMAVSSSDRLNRQVVAWAGQEEGIPFVTIATADGGRTWEPRPGDFGPGVDNLNFNAVSFSDPLRGHAVGAEGRIVATADGGRTWELQRSGGVETLNGVAFADARRGVAVGTVTFTTGEQKALVLATDDGGGTWVTRFVPDTVRLLEVDFSDHATAWAVGCGRAPQDFVAGTYDCLEGEGSIVQIAFLPPAAASSSSGGWWRWAPAVGGLALVIVAVALVSARRRRAGR